MVVILLQIPLYFIISYITFSLLLDESLVYRVIPNSANPHIIALFFHTWVVCELIFAMHYALAKRRLGEYNHEIPEMSPEDRWSLINECIQSVDDPVEWVTGWFREEGSLRQPDIGAIRQGNVREWYVEENCIKVATVEDIDLSLCLGWLGLSGARMCTMSRRTQYKLKN